MNGPNKRAKKKVPEKTSEECEEVNEDEVKNVVEELLSANDSELEDLDRAYPEDDDEHNLQEDDQDW